MSEQMEVTASKLWYMSCIKERSIVNCTACVPFKLSTTTCNTEVLLLMLTNILVEILMYKNNIVIIEYS